jgi:hypothetical protein
MAKGPAETGAWRGFSGGPRGSQPGHEPVLLCRRITLGGPEIDVEVMLGDELQAALSAHLKTGTLKVSV